MFLSKKNAAYLNKPPKGRQIKPRVLPGWGEDDQDTRQRFQDDYSKQTRAQNIAKDPMDLGLLDNNEQIPRLAGHKQGSSRKIYYDWDQLNDMNNIQCQKNLVEGIVQPGGVRIKPNENMLSDFVKQSKGMQPTYIGSLLLSKVQVNYPFQVKAKALYTIEYLCKKNQVYSNYFKTQSEKLKEFPEPEDNVQNYRKILKSTLNTIGINVESEQKKKQESTFSFVDPGYNDQKQSGTKQFIRENEKKSSKNIGSSKKFISPAQAKKGSKKSAQQDQIFDLIGDSKQNGNNDLIPGQQQNLSNNSGNFTFDDLLKESAQSNNSQKKNDGGFDFRL